MHVCMNVHIHIHLSKYMHACHLASFVFNYLQLCGQWSTRLLYPWDFPGKNIGVGCHTLLQGIFLTQRLNLCLLHCNKFFTISTTWEAYICTHYIPVSSCKIARCIIYVSSIYMYSYMYTYMYINNFNLLL